MLVINPISPGAAPYYFRGQGQGVWLGAGAATLGLDGTVSLGDLVVVLRGCDPATRSYLPERKPARRRAGWDLIFAAPKSVSLLACQSGPNIEAAQLAAVSGVVEHMESHVLGVGRAPVAAGFVHTRNAAGEPHLHTHVVLANLGLSEDGKWMPISSGWWPARRSLGALYQIGLRHHLRDAGLEVDWRVRPDGLGDIAGVPRAAIRATSSRGRVVSAAERHAPKTSRARSVGAARTRADSTSLRAAPLAIDSLAAGPDPPSEASLKASVTARLLAERSTFRHSDVLVALAASTRLGSDAAAANEWAEAFCADSIRVEAPLGGRARWTTPAAQRLDRELAELLHTTRAVILGAIPGRSNLLAHAAAISKIAGANVVRIDARTAEAQTRWATLTGLDAAAPNGNVWVVDHADRRAPAELLAVVRSCARHGTAPILVEGGTQARLSWIRATGFENYANEVGRVHPEPAPPWRPGAAGDARECHHPTAELAVADLLARWANGWGAGSPTLVGLGYAEVDGLNTAARSWLTAQGHIDGPALATRRGALFQAGDHTIALRRLSASIPPGTILTVAGVDERHSALDVRAAGSGSVERIDRRQAGNLGHAYALTPALATYAKGELLLLGPPESLGRHQALVAGAAVVARDRSRSAGLELIR